VPWVKTLGLSDLNLRADPLFASAGWGAVRTLQISALAIALSFPLGLVGGLMRLSDNRLARGIASVYVETVRNILLLVLRQYEAARSLRLHRLQILRLVIVPQVFRIVLPTLGNQIVSVVLGSAQASIIGLGELTYDTQSIGSSTFRYLVVSQFEL
jgi:polar amino acid transport system permease protein